MFSFFKKEPQEEKLQKKYELLMKQAFDLSKSNRKDSDTKYAEADEVLKEIERLKAER
jgi:hypothetical protein